MVVLPKLITRFNTIPIKIQAASFFPSVIDSLFLEFIWRDFPSGPAVKNPPANAGYVGSIPGLGTKIPHMWEN